MPYRVARPCTMNTLLSVFSTASPHNIHNDDLSTISVSYDRRWYSRLNIMATDLRAATWRSPPSDSTRSAPLCRFARLNGIILRRCLSSPPRLHSLSQPCGPINPPPTCARNDDFFSIFSADHGCQPYPLSTVMAKSSSASESDQQPGNHHFQVPMDQQGCLDLLPDRYIPAEILIFVIIVAHSI